VLSDEAVALEVLYLGLRTTDGLPAERLADGVLEQWCRAGWAQGTPPGRLRLTAEGWLRLDALARAATG
jgi:hypothetical protein